MTVKPWLLCPAFTPSETIEFTVFTSNLNLNLVLRIIGVANPNVCHLKAYPPLITAISRF